MKTILFVCTANICRSPMAAAILQRRVAERGLADQVQAMSAGVYAEEGHSASSNAVNVLKSRRMDLGQHRSRSVTPRILAEADIVLVMEEAHRRSLFYLAPKYLAKVFLLAEMSGRYDDIADPYGGPLESYAYTVDLLEALIDAGLPQIMQRIGVTLPVQASADTNAA